jgi:hypothetical protein
MFYLEVPNGLFTLRDLGIWDLIYEHCQYFTAASFVAVVEAFGTAPHASGRNIWRSVSQFGGVARAPMSHASLGA